MLALSELLREPWGLDSRARVVDEGLEAGQLSASGLKEPAHRCIEAVFRSGFGLRDDMPASTAAMTREAAVGLFL